MREVKIVMGLAGLFLFAFNVRGQATAKLEFEAASVRASTPPTVPEGWRSRGPIEGTARSTVSRGSRRIKCFLCNRTSGSLCGSRINPAGDLRWDRLGSGAERGKRRREHSPRGLRLGRPLSGSRDGKHVNNIVARRIHELLLHQFI
jgi:hypothetical protein